MSCDVSHQLQSASVTHGDTRHHQPAGLHQPSQQHHAATVTLLAVSFYLIATTLPVTLCYVLYLGFPEGDPSLSASERQVDPTWWRFFVYTSVRTVAQELGMSHYACNFYIYVCTSSVFRRQLVRAVTTRPVPACYCCCCCLDSTIISDNV